MSKRLGLYAVLFTGIVLGVFSLVHLKFAGDLNQYHFATEEAKTVYNQLNEGFESSSGSVSVLILEKSGGWKSYADFKLLDQATHFWDTDHAVKKVSSLTNLIYPKKKLILTQKKPFVPLGDEGQFDRWYQQSENYPDILSKFISDNKQFALLFIERKDGRRISSQASEQFESEFEGKRGVDVHFLQNDRERDEVIQSGKNDAAWVAVLSFCLILIGFYLLTKSLRGLLIIGLAIVFILSLTFAFMQVTQMEFSLHMISVPCILIVLSFTDIMHLLYYHKLYREKVSNDKELHREIIRHAGIPMLLTSFTNVLGFIVFMLLAENELMFNLALVSLVGVIIAFLTSRLIVLYLLKQETVYLGSVDTGRLHQWHERIREGLMHSRRKVLVVFSLFTVLLVWATVSFFKIDWSDDELLHSNPGLYESQQILNEHFFGNRHAEVIVTTKEGIWSAEVLEKIESVETEIQQRFDPLFINAPSVAVKRFNRYKRNGHHKAFRIPGELHPSYVGELKRSVAAMGAQDVVSKDLLKGKIIFGFQMKELGSLREKYSVLRKYLGQISDENVTFTLTGRRVISDEGAYTLTQKLIIGMLITIALSGLVVLLVLKSFRKTAGVLLVNLIPLALIVLLLSVSGLALNPVTIFLLTVLMGVCIDDTIYIVNQKREAGEGMHYFPILVTSVVLMFGFLALYGSVYPILKSFAWFFLIGISFAYLLDVFILPLFLDKENKHG